MRNIRCYNAIASGVSLIVSRINPRRTRGSKSWKLYFPRSPREATFEVRRAADCIAGARGLTNCGNVRRDAAEKNPGPVLAERGDFISDGALVSCEASRGAAPRAPQRRAMMAPVTGTRRILCEEYPATLVILAQASAIN